MFLANQVFQVNEHRYRLLWSDTLQAFWIDIDSKTAWPTNIMLVELEQMLISNDIKRIDDPFTNVILWEVEEGTLNWEKREKAWNMIKGIIDDPELFFSENRGKAVRDIKEQYKVTHQTVNRFIRRYWQRGLCQNALLPDYRNSGGSGIRQNATGKKLGRPRTIKNGIGCNITEDIERIFRQAIETKLLKEKCTVVADAHACALNVLKSKIENPSAYELPTIEQFRYFFKREYSVVDVIEKQTSPNTFDKDIKPLKSTSTAETLGPGYRYQIDATIADIYLVSEHDKTKIVGRPVVYVVVDVFSRMVVGLYIGFEGPSWVSAMMALANTIDDKVAYCKKYGIDISYDDWPVQGLPDVILADKGEFKGSKVETFSAAFGVTIENAVARRGDAKGIVERYFKTVQEKFKPYFEGIVEGVTSKKRGGNDYRLDATMDLNKFTEMVICCVLWHNNHQVLSKYDRSANMPSNIPAIPNKLWCWGLANLTGKLRMAKIDLVKINLMPHKHVTVSELGICLFGNYYTCTQAVKLSWFHRKVGKRPNKVLIAYDPRNVDQIYLRPSDDLSEYWVCELTERSRRFKGMSFWDMWAISYKERVADTNAGVESALTRGELIERMESIAKEASAEKPDLTDQSAAQRTKGIKDNKQREKQIERQRTAFTTKKEPNSTAADVIPLHTDEEPDYSFPDMTDILFEDNDDE